MNPYPMGLVPCPHCGGKLDPRAADKARALQIKADIDAGETIIVSAQKWSITRGAIRPLMARHALDIPRSKRGRWPGVLMDKIKAAMLDGILDAEAIAIHVGTTVNTARAYRGRLIRTDAEVSGPYAAYKTRERLNRIAKKRATIGDMKLKQMQAARAAGLTLEQIGGAFGVTRERVRQILEVKTLTEEAFARLSGEEKP